MFKYRYHTRPKCVQPLLLCRKQGQGSVKRAALQKRDLDNFFGSVRLDVKGLQEYQTFSRRNEINQV